MLLAFTMTLLSAAMMPLLVPHDNMAQQCPAQEEKNKKHNILTTYHIIQSFVTLPPPPQLPTRKHPGALRAPPCPSLWKDAVRSLVFGLFIDVSDMLLSRVSRLASIGVRITLYPLKKGFLIIPFHKVPN